MGNKKKFILEITFLLLVFGLTLYSVFHGEDPAECLRLLSQVRLAQLIPACLCVVAFIWGESVIIRYLLKTLGIRMGKWTCFLFSSIGFFFSCITPSASGGQPAQVVYMRQKNIPIPVSTLVLMVVTITYKAVLVILGLGLLLLGRAFVARYLSGILPVFYLGIFLNVVCVGVMLLLVFHTALATSMVEGLLGGLERLRLVSHSEKLHARVENAAQSYRESSAYFKSHTQVVLYVLALTFLQRLSLFLSTYFVYRAFELQGTGVVTIVLLQAAISISVDMLPLPGGMGISENLFLTIFLPVFGPALLPGMVLSRGLSYYTQLLLCAVLTLVAHLRFRREAGLPR